MSGIDAKLEPTMSEGAPYVRAGGQADPAISRRRFPRVALPERTAVEVSASRCMYMGVLQNLSLGGAFIETDKIHSIGEELRLRFKLPCVDTPVEAVGSVCHPYVSRGTSEGVGVQFVDLSPRAAELLGLCMDYLLLNQTD